MKYTHQIVFFTNERMPVPLTQEQFERIAAMEPMPQMLWVGRNCYNTAGIERIEELPKPPTHEKCLNCGEYKPFGAKCPCENKPRQRNPESMERLRDTVRRISGKEPT